MPVFIAHGDPLLMLVVLGVLVLLHLAALTALVLAIRRRPVGAIWTAIPVFVVSFGCLYWTPSSGGGLEFLLFGFPILGSLVAIVIAAARERRKRRTDG